MPTYRTTVVIGAQWGDEGKGKVTDYFARQANLVVRYSGGNNAGHTVVVKDKTYKHHLIPSGVLQKGVSGILGPGMVINPRVLFEEYDQLLRAGHRPRLFVDERAHVIFPYHELLDVALEQLKGSRFAAGTTKRGIGPAYADKANRLGIRIGELCNAQLFAKKLALLVKEKQAVLHSYGVHQKLSLPKIKKEYSVYARRVKPMLADTVLIVNQAVDAGKRVMFEGSGGTFMDIDHGLYPFGTATNTISGGVATGAGVPPRKIAEVVGVVKAYLSRVGSGVVPTEAAVKDAEYLRSVGQEYGTTTGRPRRCGWLDLVQVRHAHLVNGFTSLAITKIDVLHGVKKIPVCVAYRFRGKLLHTMPTLASDLERCQPVYRTFLGWKKPTEKEIQRWLAGGFTKLPKPMQHYIKAIEQAVGVPARFISLGPERNQTLVR